jgi:lipid-binding SYLF domain-containing protein
VRTHSTVEKNMFKRLIGILVVFFVALPLSAWADSCSDTANLFRKAGQSADFFKKSYGYAVFPTIGKGGIGVGGAYGKGCVYARGKHVGNTSMTQLSIGFQLGGEGYSEIIFFQDQRAFKEFTSGNFEFGAGAQAVAITLAAQAGASSTGASAGASATKHEAATAGQYYKGMATFTIIKGGLMYEASIAGQKFSYTPR